MVPIDYETEDELAPASPTASNSTLLWLSRSPSPFNPSLTSMLVPQSLYHLPILTKFQSRGIASPLPLSPTTVQSFFLQITTSIPESVPQSITAVQTPPPQVLAPISPSITQLLILTTANLIPAIPLPPLLELYSRIPPPNKAKYFSQKDLLADMRNHAANIGFAVIIKSLRPTKVYLVCN